MAFRPKVIPKEKAGTMKSQCRKCRRVEVVMADGKLALQQSIADFPNLPSVDMCGICIGEQRVSMGIARLVV
jgi:hypothetical protein